MKRVAYFIVAFVCLFGSIANAQNVEQRVAVYVTGEAESGIKKVIGSKLVTGITKSDKYIAVERTADFLAELTKEQDYQVSGVVSDNQIVKLGQQFGVRYVLVADISEVMESMFVTSRMIDVQTAQIVNSTEETAIINGMESLTKLSDNIILKLLNDYSSDAVKVTGPYSNAKELLDRVSEPPFGYRRATYEEIGKILKDSKILNKEPKFPIYCDVEVLEPTRKIQEFIVRLSRHYRYYYEQNVRCRIIFKNESSQVLKLSFIDDDEGYQKYRRLYPPASRLYKMTKSPSITPGYIYWIKGDEEK